MSRGFYETKVMRPAPPGRLPSTILEDRLMSLHFEDINAIMRERGVKGVRLDDKREQVFRIAEDMRNKQEEHKIYDYEERYVRRTPNNLG